MFAVESEKVLADICSHFQRGYLGAWLSHPSHVCCGLLSGRECFCADYGGGRWTGQSFYCLRSLIIQGAFLQLLGCAEREGAVAQSHLSYSASKLLTPVNWLGVASEREALIQLLKPSVLTGEGCWSIFSLQVECEVTSELHNGHMINGRLGILDIPWRSGQLGQHFLI